MRRGEVPQKYIWEGKILNKISKKIISLVTTAAFAVTLVPVTAFAAVAPDASAFNVKSEAIGSFTVDVDLDSAGDTSATTSELNAVKIKMQITPDVSGAAKDAKVSGDGVPTEIAFSASNVAYKGGSGTGVIPDSDSPQFVVTDLQAGGYTVAMYVNNTAIGEPLHVVVADGSAVADTSTFEATNSAAGAITANVTLKDAYNQDITVAGGELALFVDGKQVATHQVVATDKVVALTATGLGADSHTVNVTLDDQALKTADQAETVTVPNVATDVDASFSELLLDENAGVSGDKIAVEFNLEQNGGAVANLPWNQADNQTVYLWAQDANGNLLDTVSFEAIADNEDSVDGVEKVGNVWAVDGKVVDGNVVNAVLGNVNKETKVYICAGVAVESGVEETAKTVNAAFPAAANLAKVNTEEVTITPAVEDVAEFRFDAEPTNGVEVTQDVDADGAAIVNSWTYDISDSMTPSQTKTYKVTGVAYESYTDADTYDVAENKLLDVTCNENGKGITLKGLDENGQIKTNAKGEFEFSFELEEPLTTQIKIADTTGDFTTATLTVTQPALAPVHIDVDKDGGTMLAATDRNYRGQVYVADVNGDYYVELSDVVTFTLIDSYDHEAEGANVLNNQYANAEYAENNPALHDDCIQIVNAADGESDLTAADIALVWDGSAYTLAYIGDDAAHDMIPGDYSIRVALNNGGDNAVTVNFTLAEFGTVQNIDLEMEAAPVHNSTVNDNAITVIDDQVALGQRVTVNPVYVDENGIRVDAGNVSLGFNGDAVAATTANTFDTYANVPSNESLIGTVVTVKAYDEVMSKFVEKELTVVKNYQAETLAFDPTEGVVGDDNVVNVSVVDENGNVSKVNGTMSAYIADQSDETANIDLDIDRTVTNGEGRLFLESDKEGTVDVVVSVKAGNNEIYAATLTYTFGEVSDGRYIVMTIGSEQYLINNEIFDGSVDNLGAPYIDDAWRTMVPVRVLAETLGAEVEYADNVVTVVDGDTTVEMTIGEAAYTINGEAAEAEMDTVPVIGDGDRTYVPIRFLTNALGYEVNPLYNAEGLTPSVHFTK